MWAPTKQQEEDPDLVVRDFRGYCSLQVMQREIKKLDIIYIFRAATQASSHTLALARVTIPQPCVGTVTGCDWNQFTAVWFQAHQPFFSAVTFPYEFTKK